MKLQIKPYVPIHLPQRLITPVPHQQRHLPGRMIHRLLDWEHQEQVIFLHLQGSIQRPYQLWQQLQLRQQPMAVLGQIVHLQSQLIQFRIRMKLQIKPYVPIHLLLQLIIPVQHQEQHLIG